MSDYSFLKSGGSTLVEPMKLSDKEMEDISNLEIIEKMELSEQQRKL